MGLIMENTVFQNLKMPELSGISIDRETVKVREDAFSIVEYNGSFSVSTYILDITPEYIKSGDYDYFAECPGFNRNWNRPAVRVKFSVDNEGKAWFEEVDSVSVILEDTFDKPVQAGVSLPKALQVFGRFTACMTDRPYEDVAYMPSLGMNHLMVATNTVLTEFLGRCGRRLVYMNCAETDKGTHKYFSSKNIGHSQLAVSAYARFTSPYLRHDDGSNFKALKAMMNNQADPHNQTILDEVSVVCYMNNGKKNVSEKRQNTSFVKSP
jgi:hypothetical protein